MQARSDFSGLFRLGAVAALIAGLLFRRNIGAEVSLFTGVEAIPRTVEGWYALLQANPLLGLSFLAVFDLLNYALVGLVFAALCAALWRAGRGLALAALALGAPGVAVELASNNALTLLSLSRQAAAAQGDAQRATLLAAGQAVLAAGDPLAVYPESGSFVGLLLVALAGLLFSLLLLRVGGSLGGRLPRAAGVAGLLASGLDLAYCLTIYLLPDLRALWLAGAGLFWMLWHLLVGALLWRLARQA